MVVLGGLVMLCVGIILGIAVSKSDASCSNETRDGGITITETCVRTWTP